MWKAYFVLYYLYTELCFMCNDCEDNFAFKLCFGPKFELFGQSLSAMVPWQMYSKFLDPGTTDPLICLFMQKYNSLYICLVYMTIPSTTSTLKQFFMLCFLWMVLYQFQALQLYNTKTRQKLIISLCILKQITKLTLHLKQPTQRNNLYHKVFTS